MNILCDGKLYDSQDITQSEINAIRAQQRERFAESMRLNQKESKQNMRGADMDGFYDNGLGVEPWDDDYVLYEDDYSGYEGGNPFQDM